SSIRVYSRSSSSTRTIRSWRRACSPAAKVRDFCLLDARLISENPYQPAPERGPSLAEAFAAQVRLTKRLSSPDNALPVNTGVVCVDLDGTLITGDLLWEAFAALLKRDPGRALRTLLALRHGKAAFKRAVAIQSDIDPAMLSYREDLLAHLREIHH